MWSLSGLFHGMTVTERVMAIGVVSLSLLILFAPSLPSSRRQDQTPVGYHIPLG